MADFQGLSPIFAGRGVRTGEWAIVLLILCGRSLADDLPRWDRAICLQSVEQAGQESRKHLATGFLVRHQKRLFLVTADHAARQTNRNTRVLYADGEGKPQWAALKALCPGNRPPWRRFENSDLATAEVVSADLPQPVAEWMQRMAIPHADIADTDPERTTDIEVAGFPMGLGLQQQVSPIVVKGHIASRAIATENEWGSEPMLYSFPDLAQGTSGGPVFLSDDDSKATTLVGMYVGVIFDKSGGKLSKLVPSRLIKNAVARHPRSETPNGDK
ncbi:MAG: serine protease [Planctomycetaceae bacterium]|nr:serine protease [Planctomycetaceae bacterium]